MDAKREAEIITCKRITSHSSHSITSLGIEGRHLFFSLHLTKLRFLESHFLF